MRALQFHFLKLLGHGIDFGVKPYDLQNSILKLLLESFKATTKITLSFLFFTYMFEVRKKNMKMTRIFTHLGCPYFWEPSLFFCTLVSTRRHQGLPPEPPPLWNQETSVNSLNMQLTSTAPISEAAVVFHRAMGDESIFHL